MFVNLIIAVMVAAGFLIYLFVILPRMEQKRVDRCNQRFECLRNLQKQGLGKKVDHVNIVHTSEGWRRAGNVTHVPFKQDQN